MAVLTKAEHDARWQNATALRECARPHDFVPAVTEEYRGEQHSRFRCTKCGGDVDGACARFYDEGRADERALHATAKA